MPEKVTCDFFDPKTPRTRSRGMLTGTRQIDVAGGALPGPLYSGPRKGRHTLRKSTRVTLDNTTEAQWIECVQRIDREKDQAAFRALFDHFAPRVKGFLMRSGADAALAEECTQDVMAAIWHKAHMFDPSRASVATWVFTIARNRKIDLLRKERRPEPEDLSWGPEAEPDQEDALTLQQESAKLSEAIAALPEKQRDLIQRAYFGDLSHGEIADATGLPLGTIKSRIRLALERLRHAMK